MQLGRSVTSPDFASARKDDAEGGSDDAKSDFASCESEDPEESEDVSPSDVRLTVMHAINGDKGTVTVHKKATLFEVKTALAMEFDNGDIITAGRIGLKRRGAFVALKDAEPVLHRRHFLFSGPDFAPQDDFICSERGPAQAGMDDFICSEAEEEEEEVSVTVKHAIKGDTVTVTVPSDATLLEVKTVVANKVMDQDILSLGRFVLKHHGSYTSIRDSEPLNHRRDLLFLGTDLTTQAMKSPPLRAQQSPHQSPSLTPQQSPSLKPQRSPQQSPSLIPQRSPQQSPSLKPQQSPSLGPQRSPQQSPLLRPQRRALTGPPRPGEMPEMSLDATHAEEDAAWKDSERRPVNILPPRQMSDSAGSARRPVNILPPRQMSDSAGSARDAKSSAENVFRA